MTNPFAISAQNFRAIEPLPGPDGRSLRERMLFRSGDLSELTDACVVAMRDLGIRSVVDLRSASERRHHPYNWLPIIDSDPWGEPSENAAAAIGSLVRNADSTVDDVMAAMCALYRDLPFSHADSYATLFRRVAEGRAPVLFGCAAGKDRTGVGALLLLWAIGVDSDAIMDDYLLTNANFETLQALAARKFGWQAGSAKVDAGLRAEPAYLHAAIEAVEERCGGIDGYVETILGIDPDTRMAIERQLLG